MKDSRGACVAVTMAAILGFAVMSTASATCNSNIVGVPTEVLTYEGGVLYFTISTRSSGSIHVYRVG
jgi:hypothetical protein